MSARPANSAARGASTVKTVRNSFVAQRPASTSARVDDLLNPTQRILKLIDESLEDGLLRYSRRRAIMAEARRLGFSDFHTHLLIAQIQHGDTRPLTVALGPRPRSPREQKLAARFAAATILAMAMMLTAIRWLAL